MELNYIKEFVHLAEVGNFLTASEDLFISQSSLSKHIKAIETELNTSLFLRTTRKVSLTEAGTVFLKYASQIAKQQENYQKALNDLLNKDANSVTIGVMPTMAQYDITDIIYSFQRRYPQMKLSLTMGDTYDLKAKLDDGILDLAFLRETEQSDEYYRIFICSDKLITVVPVNHPFASQPEVNIKQLENEDLCVIAAGSMLYDLCDETCKKAGFDMKVFYSSHHLTTIADFVTKGQAIALITEGQTKFMRNPNVKVINLNPEVITDISLCYRTDKILNEATRNFIDTTNNFLIKRQQKSNS